MNLDISDASEAITFHKDGNNTMQATSGQEASAHSLPENETKAPKQDHVTNDQSAGLTDKQRDVLDKLDLAPATLEALKTLSAISSTEGIEKLSACNKLTASLEQIRAKKNMKLFEKLDKIRQDFSGLNHKIAKMEESIYDLREVTSNLVKSLPPTSGENQ